MSSLAPIAPISSVFLNDSKVLAESKCVAFISPVPCNHAGRMCNGEKIVNIGDCANPQLLEFIKNNSSRDIYRAHFFDGKKVYALESKEHLDLVTHETYSARRWVSDKPLLCYIENLAKTGDIQGSLSSLARTHLLQEIPAEESAGILNLFISKLNLHFMKGDSALYIRCNCLCYNQSNELVDMINPKSTTSYILTTSRLKVYIKMEGWEEGWEEFYEKQYISAVKRKGSTITEYLVQGKEEKNG